MHRYQGSRGRLFAPKKEQNMSENMSEKKICAGYIRVSTDDQVEYSPESQLSLLREYARKNNMLLPEEFVFRDEGISGRTAEKRPGFMRLIATAKQKPRPFETILVWKFSRFARNQEESIVYKSLLKKENDIDVVSISEPLAEGPFGGLIERIIEWFDEYYSIRLSGEVTRGMTERARRGKHNSVAPFGYSMNGGELTVVPEEAETVRQVYRSFLQGETILSIVKRLNGAGTLTRKGKTWENRTVRYLLTNPVYAGKIRWNPEGPNNYHVRTALGEETMIVPGSHEAIIAQEDFDAVQEKLRQFERKYKGTGDRISQRQDGKHMLQGVVKCSACGATMTVAQKFYMNCVQYIHGRCTESHSVRTDLLEYLVLNAIELQFDTLDFDVTQDAPKELAGEHDAVMRAIDHEQMIMDRCREAYLAGIDTLEEYRANKAAGTRKIEKLQQRLQALRPAAPVDKKAFAEQHRSALARLRDPALSGPEKNQLIRTFVDSAVYNKAANSVRVLFKS